MIRIGEDVEKLELLCTSGGNVNCAAAVQNNMVDPQKAKNRVIV